MSTAMPQIPPRPARAHDKSSSTLGSEIPKIPPRPTNRRLDRSISPSRESFARSPLNETPFLSNQGSGSKSSLYSSGSANNSSTELPLRPSSVVLPSIGQEGSEYDEVFGNPDDLGSSPTQTRNIANDLKLHAPKPSLPTSSAKQRLSTVTRTDSGQAAAFGIGKAGSDDKDPSSRSLKSKPSFTSQTSNGTERPPSSLESEHGIPEIGQRVPMYPNAGDVQAPSPSVTSAAFAPGIGFHNDGTKPRHHGRKTSGRGEIPLDVYGKYGHGPVPHDRFEKAYYEKHPELYKKETGHYHGPFAEGRAEWAMSSEDLNKIVRDTASRGAGVGTTPTTIGTPSEQIGFQATEEYASRMSSPRPQSGGFHLAHSNTSQTHVDSPLRKESFQGDAAGKEEFEGTLSRSLHAPSDTAFESEVEDEDTIHVDDPDVRRSKIYGGTSRFESTENLEPFSEAEEDAHNDQHGYSAPILASDEVAKEPFGWELQPAVSPNNERKSSFFEDGGYHQRSGSASSLSGSRPTSRPGSIHGTIPGLRVSDSTPLEDLDEYEPLFPEDEKSGHAATPKKPLTAADRLKRPELKNRKFPSQDIWEDTPNSLQYTATVSTPQLPEDTEKEARPPPEAETPEQAFAKRQEALAEQESTDSESFLNREKKPWANKSHLVAETRPMLKQRFPSRDIWEDAPDSLQLETTVATPQTDEKELLSPPSERPTTGAVVYHQEKAAAGIPLGPEEGRATTGIAKPSIPQRPTRSKASDSPEKSQAGEADGASPPIPIKSKPVIPPRPSKPITRGSSENVPLSKSLSNSSTKSIGSDGAIVAKPKPPVPSRPVGSKIAALQGGFMSDLNKRLQLGPQAPKKEEVSTEEPDVEKEKVPLADARKGRARGPARRAPAAKSPAPSSEAPAEKSVTWGLCTPSTVWQIDPEKDSLSVPSIKEESAPVPETKPAEAEIPTLATNTAGQDLHAASEIAPPTKKDLEPEASALVPSLEEQAVPGSFPSESISTEAKSDPSDESAVTSLAPDSADKTPLTDPAVKSLATEPVDEEEPLSGSTATLKPADADL